MHGCCSPGVGAGGVGGGGGPAAYPHAAVPSSPKLPSVKYSGVPPNPYVPSVPRRGCVPAAGRWHRPRSLCRLCAARPRFATHRHPMDPAPGVFHDQRSTAARMTRRLDRSLTRWPQLSTTNTSTRALPLGETTGTPADTPGLRAAVHSSRRTSRRVAAGERGCGGSGGCGRKFGGVCCSRGWARESQARGRAGLRGQLGKRECGGFKRRGGRGNKGERADFLAACVCAGRWIQREG